MAQEIEAPSLAVKEEGTERISPSHLMWCALWCICLLCVCIEIQINVYKPKNLLILRHYVFKFVLLFHFEEAWG